MWWHGGEQRGFVRRSVMSQPWNLPERQVTPEPALPSRRRWLKRIGVGGLALAAGGVAAWWWLGDHGSDDEVLAAGRVEVPGAERYPAATNPKFRDADRPLTPEVDAA